MKNTNKKNRAGSSKNGGSTSLVSELKNRTEQLSEAETASAKTPVTAPAADQTLNPQPSAMDFPAKPYVNFAEREFNRSLPVEKVLEKLKRWMPAIYPLAEVVGRRPDSGWVWITFPEPPAERVRAELSQLGFHWNNIRKCWQHPCGATLPRGTQEPRQKYEVWFPNATATRARKQAEAAQAAA